MMGSVIHIDLRDIIRLLSINNTSTTIWICRYPVMRLLLNTRLFTLDRERDSEATVESRKVGYHAQPHPHSFVRTIFYFPIMKNLKNLLDRKPKVARPRKTQDSNTRAPGLDQAKFVFQALSNLGDGVLTIPGLKAAAQLVVQIIEVAQVRKSSRSAIFLFPICVYCQKVESNQADCAVVAERAYQLVNTAITAVASRPDAEIDDHLKQNVDSLTT